MSGLDRDSYEVRVRTAASLALDAAQEADLVELTEPGALERMARTAAFRRDVDVGDVLEAMRQQSSGAEPPG